MRGEIRDLKVELVTERKYNTQCTKRAEDHFNRLCLAVKENTELTLENQRLIEENLVLKEATNYAAVKNMEFAQRINDLTVKVQSLNRTSPLMNRISEAMANLNACLQAPFFGIFFFARARNR